MSNDLEGLLARLDSHWQRVGANLARSARAGLDSDAIDALTASVGITLPLEARTWFQWHDGSGDGVDHTASLGPRFELWSLSLMVAAYREERAFTLREKDDAEDPYIGWPRTWFPLTRSSLMRDFVVIDTGVAAGEVCGVGAVDGEGNTPVGTVHSLTDLVRFWVDCLDSGLYSWDLRAGIWRASRPGPPGNSPFGNFYY